MNAVKRSYFRDPWLWQIVKMETIGVENDSISSHSQTPSVDGRVF